MSQTSQMIHHPIFCLRSETHTDGMKRFLNPLEGKELEAQGRAS